MTEVGGGTRTGSPDEGLMLTTKGDIHSFDVEDKRLPVGPDGQILTADSLQALGVKWAAPAVGFNLTTKGDIHTFDTDQNRLPVGTNGQVLTADSVQPLGIKWADPASAEVFTWTNDHDAATNNLLNVGFVQSNALNPATAGAIRLGNAEDIFWRNAANSSNLGMQLTSNNQIRFNADVFLGSNKLQFADTATTISQVSDLLYDVDTAKKHLHRIGDIIESELTITKLDIDAKFLEIESIGTPGVTGSATTGRIFMDSANSEHLSIIRNAGIIDLEGGGEVFTWTAAHDASGNNLLNVGFIESNAAIPATAGAIRLGTADEINFRNSSDTGDGGLSMVNNIFTINVNGAIEYELSTTEADFKGNRLIDVGDVTLTAGGTLTLVPSGATGFMDIGEITTPANPAANIGRLYVKDVTATTTLFFRDSAGVETNLLAVGGGDPQTPIAQDIQYAGFDIKDISNVEFRDTTGAPAGSVRAIYADSGGIILNVATATNFDFQSNGASFLTFESSANGIALGSGIDLRMGDNDITFDSINVSIFSTAGRMFFDVTATDDDYNWRFANATQMVMNIVKLDIQDKFIELESIASPGVTGSATVGRLFMDSGNSNRISTIRNGVVFDLETGLEITTWTVDHSMGTFKLTATAANNVILNAPTGQAVSIEVAAGQEYSFGATTANFLGNVLTNVSRYETDAATLPAFGAFRLGNQELIVWKSIGSGEASIKVDGADKFNFAIGGQLKLLISTTEILTNNSNLNMGSGQLQGNSGTDTLLWVAGNLIIDVADTFNYQFRVDNATIFTIAEAALTFIDAQNIVVNATTGTKIATATTQKLAFWNATPIVQPAHIADPSGGATVDAEARTAIDAINALLASTGLSAAA